MKYHLILLSAILVTVFTVNVDGRPADGGPPGPRGDGPPGPPRDGEGPLGESTGEHDERPTGVPPREHETRVPPSGEQVTGGDRPRGGEPPAPRQGQPPRGQGKGQGPPGGVRPQPGDRPASGR